MRAGSLRSLVVLVAASACVGCSGPRWHVVRNDAPHRDVIVFGDSLALGVGASSAQQGFVGLLFERIRAADPTARLTNFAVGGAVAQDVAQTQVPGASGSAATDIWLCVGGNDVTHATPTDQFSTTERALVAALRAAWPQAHIVVFGVPDVSRSPLLPGLAKIKLHNDAALDDAAARDAAKAGAADFIDLFSFSDRSLDVSEDFSADAFHPNDRGYAAIAEFAAKEAF